MIDTLLWWIGRSNNRKSINQLQRYYKMTIITKQQQAEILGISSLSGQTQDFILNQPQYVTERHESRKDHVMYILNSIDPTNLDYTECIELVILELIGQGGHSGMGSNHGGSTDRLPIFQSLGSGRKRASDGHVYDRLLVQAMHEYMDKIHGVPGQLVLKWEPGFYDSPTISWQYKGVDGVRHDTVMCLSKKCDGMLEMLKNYDAKENMLALVRQLILGLVENQDYIPLLVDVGEYTSASGVDSGGIYLWSVDEEDKDKILKELDELYTHLMLR